MDNKHQLISPRIGSIRSFARSLLIVGWVGLSAQILFALDIWLPRQHVPAFVQPGSNFVAEIRGGSNLSPGGWQASISNELRGWSCTIASASFGKINQGRENGWRLSIRPPLDAPPELFQLSISHNQEGSTNQQRAVVVVRDFEESFYILQLTDQHITNDKAVAPNGNAHATYGNGSTDAMRWAAPVINLINPRFVLMTGDNNQIYNEATSWCGMPEAQRRIRLYLEALKAYSAPTVMVNGNHDVGWSSYTNSREVRDNYEAMIGQRVFSLRMGSFYVLGNEYTYNEFLTWARNDYAAAWTDPTIKYRLIAQHYPDSFVTVAYATNPCNLMLVGHSHKSQTYQTTPYPIQVAATSQSYQKASFYHFHRTPGGWQCPQATTHTEATNVWTLFGDWGSNQAVSATFALSNDGTRSSNLVTVTNLLPQDFYHGRVKFLMARGAYNVVGGTIEAQYHYHNGQSTAVLVRANLRKQTTTRLIVKPAAPRFGSAKVGDGKLILSGTDGAPGTRYHVLNSTNAALSQSRWTCVATNPFDEDGGFAFTNAAHPGSAGHFFRLLIP